MADQPPAGRVRVTLAEFDPLTFGGAVERIRALARERRQPVPFVVTPNVDLVMHLESSEDLRRIYADAALLLADGMPIVWASRWLGTPLPERVAGSDLLPALCGEAARDSLSVFLMGGPPGAAEEAARKFRTLWPTLRIGSSCPPRGFEQDEVVNRRVLDEINAFDPDLLFVGIGSPKQERWMHRSRDDVRAGIMLGVGAAVEFSAGTRRRAPRIVQRLGAEWLFRLLQEPGRLGPRYAKDFRFFPMVWRQWRAGRQR